MPPRAIVVVASLLLAACGPQNQFDLACKVQYADGRAENERIRVDLGAMKFCWDDCRFIADIQEADAVTINFTGPPAFNGMMIDRRNGAYIGASKGVRKSGVCERKRFSGWPKQRF